MVQLNLTGADLNPLAHESSCSILLRLCWLNALDEKVLGELLNIRRIYPSLTFDKAGWLAGNPVSVGLGWDMPCPEEANVLREFGKLSKVFFVTTFRICRLCIAAAYHSYWHQFSLINECPFHKAPLTNACIECGKTFPPYALNKSLFARPYHCNHCKSPLSGKRPLVGDHLNLRCNRDLLTLHFGELYSRYQDNLDTLSFLKMLSSFHGGITCVGSNSLDADFLIKEVYLHTAGSDMSYMAAVRFDITVLSWKTKFFKSNVDTKYYWCMSRSTSVQTISAVYRSTVRYLRNWIVKDLTNKEVLNDAELECVNGLLNIGSLSSYVLAYHLTRMSFEDYALEPLSVAVRFFGLRLDEFIPNYSYAGRQPKLAWRALFFSVFASMYWRVEFARKDQGFLNIRSIRTRTDPSLVKAVFRQVDNILSGYVVFPAVPLMPTSPFKKTHLGIKTHFREFQP